MCVNKREITLSTGRTMYFNCGHCPACQQEKAIKRSDRIRWQKQDKDLVPWFFVLSYDNKYIPYIRQSEFDDFVNKRSTVLPVHRDFDCKWRQKTNKEGIRTYEKRDIPLVKPLAVLEASDFEYYGYKFDFDIYKNYKLPLIRKWISRDKVIHIADKSSVAWYSDVQNFIKRHKSYLTKKYEDEGKFFNPVVENYKYFVCTEYGEEAQRCHIHVVLWTPEISQDEILDSISQAWLYCDRSRIAERFGRAYDPASYVASYVNSRSSATTFYRYAKPFMCKHKISQDFGFAEDSFSAESLFQMYLRRDCHVFVQRVRERKLTTDSIIVPKYVVSRFFPKYRGFHRLTSNEIRFIAANPDVLGLSDYWAKKLGYFKTVRYLGQYHNYHFKYLKEGSIDEDGRLQIDWKGICTLISMIKKRRDRFCAETGRNVAAYADCYANIWVIRSSNILVDAYEKVNYHSADYLTLFDNILDVLEFKVYHEICCNIIGNMDAVEISNLPRSPNDFPENIAKSANLEYWHYIYAKDKYVSDSIYNKLLMVG